MATKVSAENRSKLAEACLDFGSHILRVRLSSVTPDEAQGRVKDLFDWFAAHDGFTSGNTGIAIHAIDFGEELLESRKTSTIQEAIDAIQNLYSGLSE